MSFSFKPTATYAFFRVCVPEPWRVYDRLVTACTNDVQPEHCVYFNLSDRWFTVYTTDPDAPAINLIAEKIPPE